jgi:hypothetical protein
MVGGSAVSLATEELMRMFVGVYGLPIVPTRAHSQSLAAIQTKQNTSLKYHMSLQYMIIHFHSPIMIVQLEI